MIEISTDLSTTERRVGIVYKIAKLNMGLVEKVISSY